MANISFGQNILPKVNNTYSLGNSSYKWHAYLADINGTAIEDLVLPTVDSTDNGKILKVSSGAWTAGDAPSGLPSVSSIDNGKVLGVSNGDWTTITPSDSTWNGVTLNTQGELGGNNNTYYAIVRTSLATTTAYNFLLTKTPTAYAGARYDGGPYLYSTTPSSGDDSTKVATTAFVQTAISGLGSSGGSGLPSVSSTDNGKILSVSDGEWAAITSPYLTSHQDISGKANTADLATVATSGLYSDLTGTPDISGFYTKPSGGIPASDLADTYLTAATEKWSGYTISLNTTTGSDSLSVLIKSNNNIYYKGASNIPTNGQIAMYDNSACLNSTTPSSGDSSTKVATTAFVGTYFAPKADPVFTGSISMGRTGTTGTNSFALGTNVNASGQNSFAAGAYANATGNYSFAMGYTVNATASHAYALGYNIQAYGAYSHAYGHSALANASYSFAMGSYNQEFILWPVWIADTSYQVGDRVRRYDGDSTGYICQVANSDSSFTSENWTEVHRNSDFAYVFGNGTDEVCSNAYALEWSGTGRYSGDLYVNCNTDSTNGYKVATESYVTTAIANASLGGSGGSGLPSVSSSDNGKILQVSSGAWSIVTPNFLTSHQDISGKANSADLATVATSGDYGDLLNKPDLSQYLTSVPTMVGATSSAAGATGLVPAPTSADVNKFLAGDGTYKSGGLPMVILSYGNSTWAQFEAAYNNNVIVYTRASSNANPASGSQTRMAFMAYVNNATTPTEVEFQYYRSMSSHSATAMGDQVFVYKLTKTGGWSVTTRDASIKQIKVDTNDPGTVSWSSNVVTLKSGLPKVTASDNGKILKVVNGAWAAVSPE